MPPRPSRLSSSYGPIRRPMWVSPASASRGSGGTNDAVACSASSAARSRERASSSSSLSPAQSAARRAVLSSAEISTTSPNMASRRRQRSRLVVSGDNPLLPTATASRCSARTAGGMAQAFARDPPVEPALDKLRFAVHRGFRDLQNLAGLLRGASQDEPEFDQLHLPRVDRFQLVQGAVEFHHRLVADLNPGDLVV